MGYRTSLVAISWWQSEYEVVDQTIEGDISLEKLKKKGIVHDVSDDVGYIDAGAMIRKCDFPEYYLPANDHITMSLKSGLKSYLNKQSLSLLTLQSMVTI